MSYDGQANKQTGAVIKSGKTVTTKVTPETAKTLERAGSYESAKIAREIAKRG